MDRSKDRPLVVDTFPAVVGVSPGMTQEQALSRQVDLVRPADRQYHPVPVDVLRKIDLASRWILQIPDRHSPGRAEVGRVLVGILRDVDDRQLVAAPLERLAARRDVIGATGTGVKRHTEQVVGA